MLSIQSPSQSKSSETDESLFFLETSRKAHSFILLVYRRLLGPASSFPCSPPEESSSSMKSSMLFFAFFA